MIYYIYILHSFQFNKHYIGYSCDPWARLLQHQNNEPVKFTGKVKDWSLKAVFKVNGNKRDALILEKFIKKQKSRILLENLCNPNFIPDGKLAQLLRVPHVRD